MLYDLLPRVGHPCSPPFSDVSQHLTEPGPYLAHSVYPRNLIVGRLLPFDWVWRVDGDQASAIFHRILVEWQLVSFVAMPAVVPLSFFCWIPEYYVDQRAQSDLVVLTVFHERRVYARQITRLGEEPESHDLCCPVGS